jgi:hypothetical protein
VGELVPRRDRPPRDRLPARNAPEWGYLADAAGVREAVEETGESVRRLKTTCLQGGSRLF